MNRDQLFVLYKRVQNKERNAEDQLRELHKKFYPKSPLYNETALDGSNNRRELLHMMYNHLFRKIKKLTLKQNKE